MAAMKAGFAYACALLCMIVAFSAPAFSDDAVLKKQVVEQNAAPYMESFNKQDVAGLVALYATGAIIVNPAGLHTDITKFTEGVFKAGLDRIETTLDQVWPVGADTTLGIGKWRATGKNQSGAPLEVAGLWTATYVREGGVEDTDVVENSAAAAREIASLERADQHCGGAASGCYHQDRP